MCLFRKKTSFAGLGLLKGFNDSHSHILPGVDDGVQTLDEALAILDLYEKSGITTVTFTPHIMEDIPNTTQELQTAFAKFKEVYKGPVNLRLAAEYMLDSLFLERLEKDDFLLWEDKTLLVETSYFNPPAEMTAIISRIQSKGYSILLAHPERYEYMDYAKYEELKSYGIQFQLNLFSLLGCYGAAAKAKAEHLLERGFYSRFGTDIHSLRSFSVNIERKVLDLKKMEKYFVLTK